MKKVLEFFGCLAFIGFFDYMLICWILFDKLVWIF